VLLLRSSVSLGEFIVACAPPKAFAWRLLDAAAAVYPGLQPLCRAANPKNTCIRCIVLLASFTAPVTFASVYGMLQLSLSASTPHSFEQAQASLSHHSSPSSPPISSSSDQLLLVLLRMTPPPISRRLHQHPRWVPRTR
jgi:hypothetical protein